MTASMALVDFIPVALFLTAAVMLQRDLYGKMSKGSFALFAGGAFMVVTAGVFKAVWKLLYALAICDFQRLNQSFLPIQATGFFLMAAALIALHFFPQQEKRTELLAAPAPAVFAGTFVFIGMMCFGFAVLCASLSWFAVKLRRKRLVPLFVFVFTAMLCMGYLSSKDFSDPRMNWIAEIVNSAGQGLLLCGVVLLRRAGLRSFSMAKDAAAV